MKLKRRFYDDSINFRNLSIKRFAVGLFVGLISAFTIYSFFYVLSESFRVISFGNMNYGFQNSQNIISETDRSFYNLFFAGLSLIIGNSISILYIFSKPDKIINRLNPKRKRIINDQIFLGFNFMSWFNKIGLAFGVFSMCCMDFEFLPYFKPLAYLLLAVLYLDSWKNLSLVIRKNRFKIQGTHLLVMLILTIGLSKIDIINYKAIDELSLKNNPIVNLPDSDFYNDSEVWNSFELSFKLKLDENNNLEIFTEDKMKIGLYDVSDYIFKERASVRQELMYFLKVRILADKDINIKYVKMLEAELYAINQYRVIYEVYNDNLLRSKLKNGSIYKTNTSSILKYRLNSNKTYKKNLPPARPKYSCKSFYKDTLKIKINNQIKINGLLIPNTDLVKKFKNHINTETLFLYHLDYKTTYQDYIKILSSHLKAVYELREKEQTVLKKNRYDNNEDYRKEQNKLKLKFPIQIIEKRLDSSVSQFD